MKKKILLICLTFFVVNSMTFARSIVADMGDVKIYSQGSGCFFVESDIYSKSFYLTFKKKAKWIEITCELIGEKPFIEYFEPNKIVAGVKEVITSRFGFDLFSKKISNTVAMWVGSKNLDYLCGD